MILITSTKPTSCLIFVSAQVSFENWTQKMLVGSAFSLLSSVHGNGIWKYVGFMIEIIMTTNGYNNATTFALYPVSPSIGIGHSFPQLLSCGHIGMRHRLYSRTISRPRCWKLDSTHKKDIPSSWRGRSASRRRTSTMRMTWKSVNLLVNSQCVLVSPVSSLDR